MCGIPRQATGHRKAVMFPSPTSSAASSPSSSSSSLPSQESYSLSFRDEDPGTKAVFQIKDPSTVDAFRGCTGVEMRIEKHGDLTSLTRQSAPLYHFHLSPSPSSILAEGEMELNLPQKLDLDVSDRGIVGRQVVVTARADTGDVVQVGSGIVGYD